jgi:hypothetical protein
MADNKDDVISDLSTLMKDFEENVRVGDDIPYPIEVAKVTPKSRVAMDLMPSGTWVAIRPVSDNPDNKTYLGVYLGSLPTKSATTSYHLKTKELSFLVRDNPAIYVPDLQKVVYGYESWWGRLKKPEDLQQITDQDIENVWYVKALRQLTTERPSVPTS